MSQSQTCHLTATWLPDWGVEPQPFISHDSLFFWWHSSLSALWTWQLVMQLPFLLLVKYLWQNLSRAKEQSLWRLSRKYFGSLAWCIYHQPVAIHLLFQLNCWGMLGDSLPIRRIYPVCCHSSYSPSFFHSLRLSPAHSDFCGGQILQK